MASRSSTWKPKPLPRSKNCFFKLSVCDWGLFLYIPFREEKYAEYQSNPQGDNAEHRRGCGDLCAHPRAGAGGKGDRRQAAKASGGRLSRSMSDMRGNTAARCCGWTRTRKTRRRAVYTKNWAMGSRISCPAHSTTFRACSWCCWKRNWIENRLLCKMREKKWFQRRY